MDKTRKKFLYINQEGECMREEKFDATKYKNDFQKEKYDRIIVNVPKGQKKIIDEKAKAQGYKSLNAFVVDDIMKKLQ